MSEEKETLVKPVKGKAAENVQASPVSSYPKEQLVLSPRFAATDRDILAVVLEDERAYTLNEVEAALQAFKNREVK